MLIYNNTASKNSQIFLTGRKKQDVTLKRWNDTRIQHVMFERNTTDMTAKEIIKLAIFEGRHIRKIILDGEWCFSDVDVLAVLSESLTPRQYWGKVKKREFTDLQLSPVWVQLKLERLLKVSKICV